MFSISLNFYTTVPLICLKLEALRLTAFFNQCQQQLHITLGIPLILPGPADCYVGRLPGVKKTFQLAVKKIGQTQQLFQAELDAAAFHIAQMGLTDAKRLRHILLAQLANRAQELDIGADFFQTICIVHRLPPPFSLF